MLLPDTSDTNAAAFAEQLRQKIESNILLASHKVTASFGVVQLQQGFDLEQAFKTTDIALYKAKQNGRNCVKIYVYPDLLHLKSV